jgi:hypothetical protein
VDIEIAKSDLRTTRQERRASVALNDGEARLAVDVFGLTSNNITYGVMGNLMSYWQFFPVADASDVATWGRLPVWGFANVQESKSSDVAVGQRVFGYFPLASELVVSVGRVDESGFSDVVEHRSTLPHVYNRYAFVNVDPLYDATREGLDLLLRPLFITSFTIDDFIADNDFFGASTMVISSASAKTSIAAAFLLKQRPNIHVIGLTSDANMDFTSELSCYDEVFSYDRVEQLSLAEAVYIDVAGQRDITQRVHEHYGEGLKYSMIVGDTHWDATATPAGALVGPKPTLLFAPVQIAKRREEWGREVFEEKVAKAWQEFLSWSATWLRVTPVRGVDEIVATYLDLVNGRIDPSVGHVCAF